ncbi:hypothetical protein X975_03925, partial [Stegodyphus mimosarum]
EISLQLYKRISSVTDVVFVLTAVTLLLIFEIMKPFILGKDHTSVQNVQNPLFKKCISYVIME